MSDNGTGGRLCALFIIDKPEYINKKNINIMTSKMKTKQLRWLVATLMLVAAIVMPSTAWAQGSITLSKPTTGNGSAASPYQIGTAAELYWFAGLVNGDTNVCDYDAGTNPNGTQQNTSAWAVLTANITVNSGVLKADGSIADDVSGFRSWTPIGYYDSANNVGYPYSGTFDGNNHTISGLYFNDSSIANVGFFGYSCGTIQNVGVVDSYFNGNANIGGVCGQNNGGTIQSCHNSSTIYGTNNAGGVCGINNAEVISASSSTATIINCYNTGSVSVNGTGKFYPFIESGGVCGYNSAFVNVSGTAIAIIKNCFNTGSVSGTGGDYDNYVGGVCGKNDCYTDLAGSVTASITNCYNNSDIYSGSIVGYIDGGTVVENVEGKTTAQFKSGEVAYLLQGNQESNVWGQTIGTEAYPVLGGAHVYEISNVSCTSTPAYNNEYIGDNPEHNYIKGICTLCGAYQPAPQNTSGEYEIGNVGQLYWFANKVNTENATYGIANAVLTADITVNSGVLKTDGSIADDVSSFRSWTPIGNYDNMYTGTFDGKGYTVSGLYFNDTSKEKVGLFGYLGSGGKISNVGVLDSYFEFRMMGGGICGCNYGEINKCSNGGTVIGNTGSGAGGVCGMNYGTIKDCKNIGAVSGSVSNTGGVCGIIYSGTIENCLNEGVVSGTGDYHGGVCGKAEGGAIKWSYNTASVSGVFGVGGVCGYNLSGSLEGCHNTGSVSGTTNPRSFFGGVCGDNCSTIKNCYNTGNVSVNNVTSIGGVCGENSGTVTSCFNTGLIGTGSYIGGICGSISGNSSTTNCYFDSDKYSGDAIGLNKTPDNGTVGEDVMGKTTAQFKSGEVCYLLNGSTSTGDPLTWYQNLSNESGNIHPVLTSTGEDIVYQVKLLCGGGTVDVGKIYANNNEDVKMEHDLQTSASFIEDKKIYSNVCHREACGETVYYADAAGSIEATLNADATEFTVASYTLTDATAYDNECVFTVTDFTYTRTFTSTEWTTWYVPFDLTLTEEICAQYDFSRINNVHQYDTDNDGTADKTVVESFRQNAGVTLKANYPYLVRAKSEGDFTMSLPLTNVVPAMAETNSIDCQSVDYKYTFTGTYAGMGDSGSADTDPYTLCNGNQWLHFHSLSPMRHYLTIESRNVSSPSTASMRSIMLSIVGDEDTTGIVKLYDEERKASETYDLSGRRLPAGSKPRGLIIENGKVTFKK